MRVLLQVDMEGAAGITTHHELWPCWDAYWERGRPALTRDVAAAARGLLAGGAREVVVDDQHASGVPNVLPDDLPRGVAFLSPDEVWRQQQASGFDAVFQVARHARRGTNDAFVAHTMLPGLAVAVDGARVTECHLFAWRAGAPVLGISGDDKLAAQIDGALDGTPYLAVKHSLGRGAARPAFATPDACDAALSDFARDCARRHHERVRPALPAPFRFAISLPAEIAAQIAGQAGLERTGPHTVAVTAGDWWRDAEPALQAAMAAIYATLPPVIGDDPTAIARLGAYIDAWIAHDETAWEE